VSSSKEGGKIRHLGGHDQNKIGVGTLFLLISRGCSHRGKKKTRSPSLSLRKADIIGLGKKGKNVKPGRSEEEGGEWGESNVRPCFRQKGEGSFVQERKKKKKKEIVPQKRRMGEGLWGQSTFIAGMGKKARNFGKRRNQTALPTERGEGKKGVRSSQRLDKTRRCQERGGEAVAGGEREKKRKKTWGDKPLSPLTHAVAKKPRKKKLSKKEGRTKGGKKGEPKVYKQSIKNRRPQRKRRKKKPELSREKKKRGERDCRALKKKSALRKERKK